MGLFRLVVLATTLLVASVQGIATRTQSLLRVHKATNDNEARGITAGTSRVKQLFNEAKKTTNTHLELLSYAVKKPTTIDDKLKFWLAKKKTPDDVFKLLALDKAWDNLLSDPQLEVWIKFMKLYNQKNPKRQTSLITTLTGHYGDARLTRIVEQAKIFPSTAAFAKRLQAEQIQRWLDTAKDPNRVFTWLSLDYGYMFSKPELNVWVKYLDAYNKQHPDAKVDLFSIPKRHFGEQTLVDMLIAAKTYPGTEALAVRMQAEQTNAWLAQAKTPEFIFHLLRLDTAKEEALLQNPLLGAWVKYADEFKAMYQTYEDTAFSILTKYFSIESMAKMNVEAAKNPTTATLAAKLNTGLFQKWNWNGNTPDKVFTILKLDKAGDELFQTPLLTTWLKYTTYFRENNPAQRVNLLATLEKHFSDANLAKMLVAEAEKTSDTKSVATDVLDDLLRRWTADGVKPNKVYSWLGVDRATENGIAKGLYGQYLKHFKQD